MQSILAVLPLTPVVAEPAAPVPASDAVDGFGLLMAEPTAPLALVGDALPVAGMDPSLAAALAGMITASGTMQVMVSPGGGDLNADGETLAGPTAGADAGISALPTAAAPIPAALGLPSAPTSETAWQASQTFAVTSEFRKPGIIPPGDQATGRVATTGDMSFPVASPTGAAQASALVGDTSAPAVQASAPVGILPADLGDNPIKVPAKMATDLPWPSPAPESAPVSAASGPAPSGRKPAAALTPKPGFATLGRFDDHPLAAAAAPADAAASTAGTEPAHTGSTIAVPAQQAKPPIPAQGSDSTAPTPPPARLMDVGAPRPLPTAAPAPEVDKGPQDRLPPLQEPDVGSNLRVAASLPLADRPTSQPASFWERLFTGSNDLQAEQPVPTAPEMILDGSAEVPAAPPPATRVPAEGASPATLPGISGPVAATVAPAASPPKDATEDGRDEAPEAEDAPVRPLSPAAPAAATPAPIVAAPIGPSPVTMATAAEDERIEEDFVPLLPNAPHSTVAASAPGTPQQATGGPSIAHLAGQINAALSQSADGTTELALSPAELGRVKLRMKPDAGNPDRMVVMISFDRPETQDLFRRHAGELADALRAAGYSGADIGFSQEQSGGFGADAQADQGPTPARSGMAEPALPDTPTPRLAGGSGLDLRL